MSVATFHRSRQKAKRESLLKVHILLRRSFFCLGDTLGTHMQGEGQDKGQDGNDEAVHKYIIRYIDVFEFPLQYDALVINVS